MVSVNKKVSIKEIPVMKEVMTYEQATVTNLSLDAETVYALFAIIGGYLVGSPHGLRGKTDELYNALSIAYPGLVADSIKQGRAFIEYGQSIGFSSKMPTNCEELLK